MAAQDKDWEKYKVRSNTLTSTGVGVFALVYLKKDTLIRDVNQPRNFQSTIICAYTNGTLEEWNVTTGTRLWTRRLGTAHERMTSIACDREHRVILTGYSSGRVISFRLAGKILGSWSCRKYSNEDSISTLVPASCPTTYANDCGFVFVGTKNGILHTLLYGFQGFYPNDGWFREAYKIAFPSRTSVDILLLSPSEDFIFAGTKDCINANLLIGTHSMMLGQARVRKHLSIGWLHTAVFMPRLPTQPARLAIAHRYKSGVGLTGFVTVKDFIIQGYKTVPLTQDIIETHISSRIEPAPENLLLESKDGEILVIADQSALFVYRVTDPSSRLQPYPATQVSFISVDRFHVVAACRNGSLKVYTWNDQTLVDQRCIIGNATQTRGFIHLACDYSSIVSCETVGNKDVVRAHHLI